MPPLHSARLTFRELTADDVDAFRGLVVDPHVRQYLFDGKELPADACADLVQTNVAHRHRHGLGLFLVYDAQQSLAGFAGFTFGHTSAQPHLVYAFTPAHVGRGYATESVVALVAHAREHGVSLPIVATVDVPNVASIRVLEKQGFRFVREEPGAFGPLKTYALDP